MTNKLELACVQFAGQFHHPANRMDFLRRVAKIAGGATAVQAAGLELVIVGAPREYDPIARLHELCDARRYSTRHGFLRVTPGQRAGVVVPNLTNPDAQGNRAALFPGRLRAEIQQALSEVLGSVRVYGGVGVEHDETGQPVFEDVELWEFAEADLSNAQVLAAIQAHLVDHPASDQNSWFVCRGDQAGLLTGTPADLMQPIPEVVDHV